MINFEVGDLVLIPANVSLFKETDNTITHIITTEQPEYAILLDKNSVLEQSKQWVYWKNNLIFWNGDYWRCNPDDMKHIPEFFDST